MAPNLPSEWEKYNLVFTLERATWGNSSNLSTVSSPVLFICWPLYILEEVIVAIPIPSPINRITFLALLVLNFTLSCWSRLSLAILYHSDVPEKVKKKQHYMGRVVIPFNGYNTFLWRHAIVFEQWIIFKNLQFILLFLYIWTTI